MVENAQQGGNTPPLLTDPTVLTTEQLLREIEGMRRELDAMRALLEEKINSAGLVRSEQLNSVNTQFALIERQRVEQKADTTAAVAAALAAAKEAVKEQTTASEARTDKSEAGMSDRLKQLEQLFNTAIAASTVRTDDLRDRVKTLEAEKKGSGDAIKGIYALAGFLLVLLLIGGAVAGILAARGNG
jgi:nitrogen fixation/metabolism regulation signal transduction histidine kinase